MSHHHIISLSSSHPNKGGRRDSNPRELVHSQSPEPLGYDHHIGGMGRCHRTLKHSNNGQTGSRTPNFCVQNRCVPITPSALNTVVGCWLLVPGYWQSGPVSSPNFQSSIGNWLMPITDCRLPTADCRTRRGCKESNPVIEDLESSAVPSGPTPRQT